MTVRPLRFPAFTLVHMADAEAPPGSELWALARLADEGYELGVLALPAAIEESWYRLGGLGARLVPLYRGLDPTDPDEDILEEAWEVAEGLLAATYLLDDVIDALLEAFTALLERGPGPFVLRRQGERGVPVEGGTRRGLLLALKRSYREEWTPRRVEARLAATGRLGLDATPLLAHMLAGGANAHSGGNNANIAAAASEAASRLLGRQVDAHVDAAGGIVALGPPATS